MRILKGFSTLVFAFLFLMLSASSVFAADWVLEKEIPDYETAGPILSVDVEDDLILAVGYSGQIYFKDSASDWETSASGVTDNLFGVSFIDSDTAIVVGDSGVILKADGDFNSWTQITSGTTADLRAVYMYNSSYGWATGETGTVLYTSDGGDTWSSRNVMTAADLKDIYFFTNNIGWVVGTNGTFYATATGGSTWAADSTGVSSKLYDLEFIGLTKGWAVGPSNTVIKTTDGGATWSDAGMSTSSDWYEVYFEDSNNGHIVGVFGWYTTDDAGATWEEQNLDSGMGFFDIKRSGDGSLYAVGANSTDETAGIYIYDENAPSAVTNLTVTEDPTADDIEVTWSASSDDETNIDYYELDIDGDGYVNVGSVLSYTTALSEGDHTVSVRAVDEAGNTSDIESVTVTVDLSGPSVSLINLVAIEVDTEVDLVINAEDDYADVASCTLYLGGASQGAMTDNGDGTFTKEYIFTTTGSYSVYVACEDSLGNYAVGSTSSIIVVDSGAFAGDTTEPSVGDITPTNAVVNVSTEFSASVTDDVNVSACYLYKDETNSGVMDVSDGIASIDLTFYNTGTYSIQVKCVDDSGNVGHGSSKTVTITSASSGSGSNSDSGSTSAEGTTEPYSDNSSLTYVNDVDDLEAGSLIKIFCVDSTSVNDPCRAVYYFDEDGYRHAFPNEKVFFTWYDDFDDVVLTSTDVMSDVSLGSNVTYHPGIRMVKFQTVNTVFAVKKGGVLRAIDSEGTAADLYGVNWNTKIDDISDAFFGNYSFGANINDASDYNIDEAKASVSSLEDNF